MESFETYSNLSYSMIAVTALILNTNARQLREVYFLAHVDTSGIGDIINLREDSYGRPVVKGNTKEVFAPQYHMKLSRAASR